MSEPLDLLPGALPPSVDACYEGDPDLLPIDEAYRRIAGAITPIAEREPVALKQGLGRVLAQDVISPIDVPGHTNSAVDGYAVSASELAGDGSREFQVLGRSMAGKPYAGEVGAGQCVRIMTGAVMPGGTDTVLMQEHVGRGDSRITVQSGHKGGQNVRKAGEDIQRDGILLRSGRRLTPADLGLLASVGTHQIQVVRTPRVSYFSTGDELRSLGETLCPGEVYDSNRYTLFGMISRLGLQPVDLGVVHDDPGALRSTLEQAADSSDLVLTSGGVSTGDADYVKTILDDMGEVGFWRIAIRPGRPLAFGRVRDALFFGLPGNPVAVMVTFYQFVQPALRRLEGESASTWMPLMEARCPQALRKKPGRVEYYRAVLRRDEHGALEVRPTGKTGSGLLHTMSDANCFIILPEAGISTEAGDTVQVQPFHGLI